MFIFIDMSVYMLYGSSGRSIQGEGESVAMSDVCWSCERSFPADTLGGCMVCCADLCMENDCEGKCLCDLRADRQGNVKTLRPSPDDLSSSNVVASL